MDNDKLFYIKRLVGLPYEKLDIKNRHVYINDKMIDSTVHPFEFIYSMDLHEELPQHRTVFSLATQATIQDFQIPPNHYYALGDNTVSSLRFSIMGIIAWKNIFRDSFVYLLAFSHKLTVKFAHTGLDGLFNEFAQ